MARDFDGSDDQIRSSNNTGISGDVTATLFCWFNKDTNDSDGACCITGPSDVALDSMGIHTGLGGTAAISIEFAGGNGYRSAASQFSLDVWNSFIGTKTPGAINTTSQMFLNGTEVVDATSSTNTPNVVNGVFTIGEFEKNASNFDGRLAFCAAWDVQLNSNEIRALSNGVNPRWIRTANLKVEYPVWGNDSPEVDFTGGGTGTLTGTTRFTPNPPVELLENHL